jgi:hypothetical protein
MLPRDFVVMERGAPLCLIWNTPKFCDWILAQPADRFTTPDAELGGDYGSVTLRAIVDALPRALRHGEITKRTVEAVLTAVTRRMGVVDATSLRKQYTDTLAMERAVNGESDED